MMKALWINQALASQRDVALLSRGALGARLRVVVSHSDERPDIFQAGDEWFYEPSGIGPEAYVAWMIEEARARGIGAILAMRRRQTLVAHRPYFEEAGIRLAAGCADASGLTIADQKDMFTTEMAKAGLPVATTIAVDDPDALRRAIAVIEARHASACVKPAVGVYGSGYWRFDRAADPFSAYSGSSGAIHPEVFVEAYERSQKRRRLLVMEYLPGVEHSVDLACVNGAVIAAVSRRKGATCQIVATSGEPIALAEAVAAHLRLDGLVNVQTKAAVDGTHRLLEVNTRAAGGIGYAAAAGVNIPAAMAASLLDLPFDTPRLAAPVAIRIHQVPEALGPLPAEAIVEPFERAVA